MSNYLNTIRPFLQYQSESRGQYFVDKTNMISELIPLVENGNSNLCITRPRRFGKSVMANMIASFFQKGIDSSSVFNQLQISQDVKYEKHRNQHDVIYIDFSKTPRRCQSYDQYINWIEDGLIKDLMEKFPDVPMEQTMSSWEALDTVFHYKNGKRFIFVLDEWDSIFHKKFITEDDCKDYIDFLAGMFKGQGYVELTYMTGVLPIAKYSSGSTINNFAEYTMTTQSKYGQYFGFTENEVDQLMGRYTSNTKNPTITREQLDDWYDGYRTADGKRMYNPRSVVYALSNNQLSSYWTASGPYSEIAEYIINDVDGVKKDIALLLSGEPVLVNIEEYSVMTMKLRTREEIYSAMVVYGFLSYDQQTRTVQIPNRELMNEFIKTIKREPTLGYMHCLSVASNEILEATLRGDECKVEEILKFVHDTETPILSYNNETELTAVVNLAYIAARDKYYIEREEKA